MTSLEREFLHLWHFKDYIGNEIYKINKKLEEDSRLRELGVEYKNYKTESAYNKAIFQRDMFQFIAAETYMISSFINEQMHMTMYDFFLMFEHGVEFPDEYGERTHHLDPEEFYIRKIDGKWHIFENETSMSITTDTYQHMLEAKKERKEKEE